MFTKAPYSVLNIQDGTLVTWASFGAPNSRTGLLTGYTFEGLAIVCWCCEVYYVQWFNILNITVPTVDGVTC